MQILASFYILLLSATSSFQEEYERLVRIFGIDDLVSLSVNTSVLSVNT